jgi:putative FmdB family regulatory protein
MPLYEFTCNDCGARFEELIRSDQDIPTCPACSGTSVTRQLSTFATRAGTRSPSNLGTSNVPGGGCMCSGGVCPMQE